MRIPRESCKTVILVTVIITLGLKRRARVMAGLAGLYLIADENQENF
jgi:hypothetical protein